VTGELVLTAAGWSPIELVADVLATGLWPPPVTTASPTTSSTTSSSTTRPPTTATPTTRPPSTYYPYPGGSYYPGGSTTGGSTTSGGSGTFTTTTVVSNPPNLEPGSVDFDPTIVRAGRRTATLLLTDIDGDASVVDVRIRPPASRHFSVVGTSCSGLVPAGGCTIDVEFAPRRTGVLRATLVVELVGGEVVSAALTGTGVPPPTLTVIPDVMVPGQVVTVVGDGFPPSSTVELVWIDGRVVGTPDTGADGTFRETVVVLPRTPAGPAEVRVEAQPDVFRAVRADVLVERRAGVTRSPALRGAGVDVGS
jgi:hypothetical protein